MGNRDVAARIDAVRRSFAKPGAGSHPQGQAVGRAPQSGSKHGSVSHAPGLGQPAAPKPQAAPSRGMARPTQARAGRVPGANPRGRPVSVRPSSDSALVQLNRGSVSHAPSSGRPAVPKSRLSPPLIGMARPAAGVASKSSSATGSTRPRAVAPSGAVGQALRPHGSVDHAPSTAPQDAPSKASGGLMKTSDGVSLSEGTTVLKPGPPRTDRPIDNVPDQPNPGVEVAGEGVPRKVGQPIEVAVPIEETLPDTGHVAEDAVPNIESKDIPGPGKLHHEKKKEHKR